MFAFFCFNIGQIVPIRSLNLMFIYQLQGLSKRNDTTALRLFTTLFKKSARFFSNT